MPDFDELKKKQIVQISTKILIYFQIYPWQANERHLRTHPFFFLTEKPKKKIYPIRKKDFIWNQEKTFANMFNSLSFYKYMTTGGKSWKPIDATEPRIQKKKKNMWKTQCVKL